jgi:hypothetical protein
MRENRRQHTFEYIERANGKHPPDADLLTHVRSTYGTGAISSQINAFFKPRDHIRRRK